MSFLSNIILSDQDVLQGKAATLESVSFSLSPFCLCIGGREGKELVGSTAFVALQCNPLSSAPEPQVWSR